MVRNYKRNGDFSIFYANKFILYWSYLNLAHIFIPKTNQFVIWQRYINKYIQHYNMNKINIQIYQKFALQYISTQGSRSINPIELNLFLLNFDSNPLF